MSPIMRPSRARRLRDRRAVSFGLKPLHSIISPLPRRGSGEEKPRRSISICGEACCGDQPLDMAHAVTLGIVDVDRKISGKGIPSLVDDDLLANYSDAYQGTAGVITQSVVIEFVG